MRGKQQWFTTRCVSLVLTLVGSLGCRSAAHSNYATVPFVAVFYNGDPPNQHVTIQMHRDLPGKIYPPNGKLTVYFFYDKDELQLPLTPEQLAKRNYQKIDKVQVNINRYTTASPARFVRFCVIKKPADADKAVEHVVIGEPTQPDGAVLANKLYTPVSLVS